MKAWLLGFTLALLSGTSFGRGLALRFGPMANGTGGSNPVSIPPSFGDTGFSYITDKDFEYNVSATALAIAKRQKTSWGGYVSLGGGFAFSGLGSGIGPYAGFGYDGGCLWKACYTVEYQQALGVNRGIFVSPYSVRMGTVVWF